MNRIRLDGATNFRDIGGLLLNNGQIMKTGLIFRSDELSQLTSAGWRLLVDSGVKCIIDLRTPNECRDKSYKVVPEYGLDCVNIPIRSNDRDLSRWQFFPFFIKQGRNIDFEQYMHGFYYRMAFERNREIKSVLALLVKEQFLPTVIHCTAGKDRTGFIVALLQILAGASMNDVLAEYLITNDLGKERIKKIETNIRWMSLGQVSGKQIRPLLEARCEYLEPILRRILNQYGSVDAYLQQVINLDKGSIIKLRELMT